MKKDYILTIDNVSKSFPGVKALDNVSFKVERGTVHALVGENGAGKSTLIKVLGGIYSNETGNIYLNGKPTSFRTPYDAKMAGISVVHQELKLAESLSITENIFLGNLLYTKRGLVDWKTMHRRAKEEMDSLGIDIDVSVAVETLPVAKKQMVEICKNLITNCQLLLMDEPSATLTEKELNILFSTIKKLKEKGITVIYISHRLQEIFSIADNVTVLRDGKHIATVPVASVDRDRLISMMVGRELGDEYPKESVDIGEVLLEVKGLSRKGVLHDISFSVRRGEILGFAGLVGAGRTEIARAVLGIDRIDHGEVLVRGTPVKNRQFKDAIKRRFGLIPEDRKQQGVIQSFSVKENICLVSIDRIIKGGIIRNHLEQRYAREYVDKLRIMAPSVDTQIQYLSGGNQQKVVIAKWLLQESEIIFLDEPTRGIDVGAKSEIYKLINKLAGEGKAVIMISSEMPELLGLCDRILVIHHGRIVGELSREEASQEKIIALCV
jgi:ABC-type sugar transport system ATPase subunit